jgi:hypothetical protein
MYSLVIGFIGIVLGSVSLTYPFGRDQGIYAYIGKLLLEGKIQYKYAFDLKPPGVHYLFALAQSVAGESMFSMRVFDIVWQSITGFVLFIITYNMMGSKLAGLLSSFIYIFLYYRLDYWHTLQADGFLNLPFSLCVLLLITSGASGSGLKILFSGILFAVTILFKYTIIIFLPFLFLIFLLKHKKSISNGLRNCGYFLLGFCLIVIVVLGLYYLTGSLEHFLNIQFVQIPLYAHIGYSTESFNFILANTFRLFFGSVYSPLIIFSMIMLVYFFWKKGAEYHNLILLSWMLGSLANLILQWKFFVYHFLVLVPPFAVGTASLLSTISKAKNRKHIPFLYTLAAVFGIAYILIAFRPYLGSYDNLISYLNGAKSLEQLYILNGTTSDSAFMIRNTLTAVEYVKMNTNESDGIYVWGFDPLVYYLSGRKCVSRFIYNYPLYWKGNNSDFRAEFLGEINSNKPRLILVSEKDPLYFISGYHEDSKQILARFTEFHEFLDKNYTLDTKFDNFNFYRLKGGQKN